MPGTTRDHIEVPLAIGGIPFVLTDTAGIRSAEDAVEQIGVARAKALAEAADILLWLGDPTDSPDHPRLIRVHSKMDLDERCHGPEGSVGVSAHTGAGVAALLERLVSLARTLVPAEDELALNRRQAAEIGEAAAALQGAFGTGDIVIGAERLRQARVAFDRLTGRAGVEDVLDALFGRFCLGK